LESPAQDTLRIECKEPIAVRFIPLVLLMGIALFYMRDFGNMAESQRFLAWGFWLLALVYSQVVAPDVVVYDNGLEIKSLWKTTFVEWEHVRGVDKFHIHAQVYVFSREFSLMTRIRINYPFFIGAWRKNYRQTMGVMKEKLGDRFTGKL
jgi:hypothetical protein